MIFDTHAHYDDEAYNADRDEVIRRQADAKVSRIVNCGCDVKSSEAALSLAHKYGFVYASVGLHPENVGDEDEGWQEKIKALSFDEKCVAIGEIGLDYHYGRENAEAQKAAFAAQIILANERALPVIIHERDAYADAMKILKSNTPKKAVMHCFSGNRETLREVLELGFYIGVGGTLTFKNNKKTVEMLPFVPQDKLLFETDAPYLSPEPLRGKRNSSENIRYVAQRAADILGKSADYLLELTENNAKEFYSLFT